ncbi:hypothetical protein F2Q68_00011323 [Brassica cretica]|uniref:Uncharacterized protein n=1 Tax=Brassica cretica TaxID=69181 RepID=A0A8S9KZ26_BRACR|nr:hypothetical protein F2Q68_00011323 [Brassica cretica]
MEEHVVIRFDPSDEEEEHLDFVVSSVKSKRKMTKARFETTGEGDCRRGSWRSGETTGRRLKGRSAFRTEGSDGSGFLFSDLRRSPHDDGA